MKTVTAETPETRQGDERPTRIPLAPDEPQTLVEMFRGAARKHPRPDALNYKEDGRWRQISSAEMIERATHIALGLYAIGLRPNDRAAILSGNCPEWTLADAGCLFLGAIDVPIYTTQAPAQVRYILDDSQARVIFLQDTSAYERIRDELSECRELQHIVFFHSEPPPTAEKKAISLIELERRGRALGIEQPELLGEFERGVRPGSLATIIYTSGTTGEPKGVMLTHSNLTSNLLDVSAELDFSERDVVLSMLPLSHVFERLGMYMYIHYGMSVYYAESLERIGDNMREVRPTLILCVPRLFEKIYARIRNTAERSGRVKAALLAWAVRVGRTYAERGMNGQRIPPHLAAQYALASRLVFSKWRAGVGGRLRTLVSGGAPLPKELGYVFAAAGLPILECYGLTETSPGISVNVPQTLRIGTVGRPIRNVEVRVSSDGEIETRGPHVMRGYYNKPEATGSVLSADGWFKTGDIGIIDADGFLSITDRKKELFKTSGGKYIAPQVIEERIKRSRFVGQVVLIGDGRRFPAALIVPDWEQLKSYAEFKGITDARTPAELCQHPRIIDLFERQIARLTADLAQYERVKRVALLEQELTVDGGELTPTMKVKRRVIDEKYRALIDGLYAEP